MASQESQQKEVEGGEGGGGGGEEGVASTDRVLGSPITPDRSVEVADSRRIGPWHPPDHNRQRLLADRLSNPALRSSRPTTSAPSYDDHRLTPDPYSLPSPYRPHHYHPSRASTSAGVRRYPLMMNNGRASSGPPSSPRRQISPRYPPSHTPHYGMVSPRRQPPLFSTSATSRKVTEEELDDIVGRVTRPTVSSRGGVDLQNKDFTYIQTPRLKTLPVVPGLDRRYMGLQRVDSARMEDIVFRLTRMTSAYKAKFAPNKNVYVDMEPGAHMVTPRSARSAV